MSTLLDVITGALTSIGQLGQGQTPSAEDASLGMRRMNLLLGKFGTQRLFLYNIATRSHALSANQADYSMGPSGSWDPSIARPTFIESAQVQVPNSQVWLPLNIIDKAQWDAIRNKGAKADIPDTVWVEPTYPALSIHFNPAPLATPTVKFGVWEPFTKFTELQTDVAFPEGYEEFLEAALAIAMAPDYDQPVPQSLLERRNDAMAAVMKINAQALGGSLGEHQKLSSPNVGQPMPAAPAPAQ